MNMWRPLPSEGNRCPIPRGKAEQVENIAPNLREVEFKNSRGVIVAEAVKKIGVTEQTYYRSKRKFGGLRMSQAKRLRELAKESAWFSGFFTTINSNGESYEVRHPEIVIVPKTEIATALLHADGMPSRLHLDATLHVTAL